MCQNPLFAESLGQVKLVVCKQTCQTPSERNLTAWSRTILHSESRFIWGSRIQFFVYRSGKRSPTCIRIAIVPELESARPSKSNLIPTAQMEAKSNLRKPQITSKKKSRDQSRGYRWLQDVTATDSNGLGRSSATQQWSISRHQHL